MDDKWSLDIDRIACLLIEGAEIIRTPHVLTYNVFPLKIKLEGRKGQRLASASISNLFALFTIPRTRNYKAKQNGPR